MSKNTSPACVRWGIVGTGYAAARFVEALRLVPNAEVVAVASRNANRAREFAAAAGVGKSHCGAEELARNKDVDVVYVATPNSLHREHCLWCLSEGKAVLCEKPFALNAAQAAEVVAMARSRGLFCMEGMWTRFLPVMRDVRELVASGELGEIRMFSAGMGHPMRVTPESGLFRADMGGGALLDLGVYGLSLASWLMGKPEKVKAEAKLGSTGVDEHCCVTMTYPNGAMAAVTASLRTLGANDAVIMGSRGRLRIHEPLISPVECSLKKFDEEKLQAGIRKDVRNKLKAWAAMRRLAQMFASLSEQSMIRSFAGNGKNYEAEEVVRCVRQGRTESEVMPLDETVAVMRVMDEARQQFGLRYPGENIAACSRR